MKGVYRIVTGLVVVCFLLTSCNKDDRNALFQMQYEFDILVPPGLNTFETHFFPVRNIPSNFQEFASNAGVDPADVVSVNTIRATLYPVLNAVDMSMMEEVIVDLYTDRDPDDRWEAAYTIEVPNRQLTELQLTGSLTDLAEVVMEEKFNAEILLRFRAITTSALQFRLRLVLGAYE